MTRPLPLLLALGWIVLFASCDPAPPRALRPIPASARPAPRLPATVSADRTTPPAPRRVPRTGPAIASIRQEPVVRIRIGRAVPLAEVQAPGGLLLDAGERPVVDPVTVASPATVRHVGSTFTVTDAAGRTLKWDLPALRLRPVRPGVPVTVLDTPYPGSVVLQPVARGLDVINHVPMEQYLPGVLTKELYGSWQPEAYEALAIAARSYALWEASLNDDEPFDLESTNASQVYGGHTASPKAIGAVERTRGQVLSFGGHVLPAFYSSTTGTIAQDAAVIFADRVPDLPPLRGGPLPAWDRASPHYRWGPILRETIVLAQRIAAWGRANRHAIADLTGLASITPVVGRSGRPASFVVQDSRGRQFAIAAEHLRSALNYEATGLPDLPFDRRVRSSHLTATVRPDTTLLQGHGFGHGVGLSQWGAQAMALEGHPAEVILGTYYPGAILRRLY